MTQLTQRRDLARYRIKLLLIRLVVSAREEWHPCWI